MGEVIQILQERHHLVDWGRGGVDGRILKKCDDREWTLS
jgi:hypothetical protein